MKLFSGRPEKEHMPEKEKKIYEVLEALDIPFDAVTHKELMTMEDCKEADEVLGATICKNLFLCNQQKTVFYLLLMDPDKKFVTKDFSKKINSSRLSFAKEEHMMEYLNSAKGSASIMGLIFDKNMKVNLVFDKEILEKEYIGCHPCINTSSIKLKTADLVDKFLKYTKHEYQVVDL